ncbi:hypothetical protein VCHA37O177_180079 [Vibrio chagasii]|nr:hypothetical protein VCHA37O177_180079 [Vibrio chagasii]
MGTGGVATCPESEKHGIELLKKTMGEDVQDWRILHLMTCTNF